MARPPDARFQRRSWSSSSVDLAVYPRRESIPGVGGLPARLCRLYTKLTQAVDPRYLRPLADLVEIRGIVC